MISPRLAAGLAGAGNRQHVGIDGRRAMNQYQLAATELAMACRRNDLGRTAETEFTKHRDDSLTLMRDAAAIVRGYEQLLPPPWIGPSDPSVFVSPGSRPAS